MNDVTIRLQNGDSFTFPESLRNCVTGVLRGEYAIPIVPDLAPIKTVLDIGGNVGSFAVWARAKWPECKVLAYEPHPGCAEYYRKNCPWAELVEKALTSAPLEDALLHVGSDWGLNSLDSRLFLHGEGRKQSEMSVMVRTAHPNDLPPADCIKIDAEGIELDVLEEWDHLHTAHIVIFEWHRETDRRECEDICQAAGLRLFAADQQLVGTGRQRWLRSKAVFDYATGKYVMP